MIPKVLHYCFGLSEDFGGKPWGLLHHVCLSSAVARLRPESVFFYHEYEPSGPWWDLSRKLVEPVKITAPRSVFDRPLHHPAHRADVVRLERLIEHGGIYLDADVLVHRDFDDLLHHSTVLGQEGIGGDVGVANAIIVAEPEAPFLERWYESYRTFRGKGHGEYWNEHSVLLPRELALAHPGEVTLLPYNAFYWPLWTSPHIEWIFGSAQPVEPPPLYASHLWESKAWPFVKGLTPGEVRSRDTNFHRWARPYLADVPDDYGGYDLAARVLRSWNHAKRAVRRRVGHSRAMPSVSINA